MELVGDYSPNIICIIEKVVKSWYWIFFSPFLPGVITWFCNNLYILHKKIIQSKRSGKKINELILPCYLWYIAILIPLSIYIINLYIVMSLINDNIYMEQKYAARYLIFMIITVFYMAVNKRKQVSGRIYRIIAYFLMLLWLEILVLTIVISRLSNVSTLYYLIALSTIFLNLGFEYILKKNGIYEMCYGDFRFFSVTKNILNIFCVILMTEFIRLNNLVKIDIYLDAYMWIWIAMCFVESIIIYYSENIEFTIRLKDRTEKTNQSIIHYKTNKIKYKLQDKTIRIVDIDEINAIEYVVEGNNINNTKIGGYCELKDGTFFEFYKNKSVGDLWMKFERLKNAKKEIIIINNEKIKDIIIEKK